MSQDDASDRRGDWDQSYQRGETPWDRGQVEELLVQAVRDGDLPRGRLLEIGCGTGLNARYLASQGYQVMALDLSPTAIERALEQGPPSIAYQVLDVQTDPLPPGPFDTIFDRGCFHVFSPPDQQRLFVEKVAAALRPGGCWLSLLGSTEGAPREHGPPRRTAAGVIAVVEPLLEVVSFRAACFSDVEERPAAWVALFRRRQQPAQPATP